MVTEESTKEAVKTIARVMPVDFRCDRGDYARVLCFISHARLRVHQAPGIPCALVSWAEGFMHNSGASRRENAESYVKLSQLVIARSGATKQSSLLFCGVKNSCAWMFDN